MNKIILEKIKEIYKRFENIGCLESGGVTRLGYTEIEDEMHKTFLEIGKENGFDVFTDAIGNSYVSNCNKEPAFWIGSHLDSVISGGKYDGVIGVIVGLVVMIELSKTKSDIPLRVAAFRCEESTNFNKCTIGSGLLTKKYTKEMVENFCNRNGESLKNIFKERNLGYEASLDGIKGYFEVHIEQGRVLESKNLSIGIVLAIVGNERIEIQIDGVSEHSGSTPMKIRKDSLCFASEFILFLEDYAKKKKDLVITVGKIDNYPNALNVISGETKFVIDVRSQNPEQLLNIRKIINDKLKEIAKKRKTRASLKEIGKVQPVNLSKEIIKKLADTSEYLNIPYLEMNSGAGHDGMCFPDIVKTGMLFIPCKQGISHNKDEYAKFEDVEKSVEILIQYFGS
ncbi:MAG: hydantoinase/carbamoylase family amidase [Sphaerochaetaceae bacterium]|nr:hydantoinase/carbamoylase family amidase [Sphaerochaetaceae bacterium]